MTLHVELEATDLSIAGKTRWRGSLPRRTRALRRRLARVSGGRRPRHHHLQRRQRRRRNHHLHPCRRAIRLHIALVADPADHRALRQRRNVRAHGRRSPAKAFRSDPRRIRLPLHVFRHGRRSAVDLGNTVAEFAGVAASMEIFGVSKYISVPLAGLIVWFLVVRGTTPGRKNFPGRLRFYLSYVLSAVLAKPDWLLAAKETVVPELQPATQTTC